MLSPNPNDLSRSWLKAEEMLSVNTAEMHTLAVIIVMLHTSPQWSGTDQLYVLLILL